MYFLDTNTCIYFLKGTHESIRTKLLALPPSEIKIPSIVKAELLFGSYKSQRRKENTERTERFLEPFEIIPFTDAMTYVYAELRSDTEKKGTPLGPNDLLIATIVKHMGGILVTNNVQEFRHIKSLKTENWTRG
jgi:tRNA(fMet)-specific endonuclease VapC